ncbi:AbrB family transcriptional regulator [Phenylobacterium sp.]|uniref:AbrB family transcriptional regulator n=1 Tax=Phenylobacterium sp. TaxID=1871053 RepID=UPI002CCBA309|nr:AbrB family transcriptional regulator [Phenylobacterium sp.]HLZ76451.1 AbrB family transcriptional regulator [Phenylobacterium sp.]
MPLQSLPTAARWAVLLAASALGAGLLQWARLPAALMLGPLAVAVLVQTAGGAVRVPRAFMAVAQAVIGCLIARSITPAIVGGFASHWPVFLAVVALSIAAGAGIGWTMSRLGIVPGTTAVWGMLPGAAMAMMVMAEAYSADFRLVAFMQYLRVVLVATAASVVALLFVHGGGGPRFAGGYFPPIHWLALAETVGVAVLGGGLGLVARIPAGVLLGPLALGAALNVLGWVTIELPPVVLIASYAVIGWNTGLRFTRDVLAAAARALPQTLGATALLMAFCGVLAWLLVVLLHVDPLTAYLATSPGGVDAAAIIAATTKVDTPFVMALQTLRVIVVLAIGPQVARWVAGTLNAAATRPDPAAPADLGDLD